MLHETCYFSSDYESELKSLEDPVNMVKQTKVVQFPYTVAVSCEPLPQFVADAQETVEKTEEELAAALERRRENGKRLQEMQARQRAEKVSACLLAGRDHELTMRLAAKIAELDEYKLLVADRINMKRADFLRRISEETPFETEAELESWIKKTEADVKRKQRKEQGLEEPVEEEPSFPLVDRPDEELDEEEIKEKRRQRLMKAGWEARVKLREEKRREKERLEEEVRLEEQEKATDPVGWARRMKEEQEVS
jgi:actin-related protein 5